MNSVFQNEIIITYDIDKSENDIIVPIWLLNRECGKSTKHTFPIVSVGGPVSECYGNEKETIFNKGSGCPTGGFLQDSAYDNMYSML